VCVGQAVEELARRARRKIETEVRKRIREERERLGIPELKLKRPTPTRIRRALGLPSIPGIDTPL